MLAHIVRTRGGVLALLFAIAMLLPRSAAADSLTLAWDANPEPDVLGYYVYIGTSSGVYTTVVDVGRATSYTFTSAVTGTTYYLTVAAYAAGPTVGSYAPELVSTTGGGPALSNPGNRTNMRGEAVSLRLSATDPNGQPVVFGAGGLPAGLSLNTSSGLITGNATTAGVFNVSVTASDVANRVTTQNFVWTIMAADEAAPTITLASPTTASSYSTSSSFITLSGTASDDIGVTSVTWASNKGNSGTAAGTASWSVVVPLQSGANVLTLAARDAANKSSSTTLTVTVDFAPSVTISSPTSSATFSASSQTLSIGGSAADDGSVSQVTWSNNRGGNGTAVGTTSWSAAGISLQAGANIITITATDNASKSSTKQLSVTWTPSPLRLTSLVSSRTAPQPADTTVTFTASATAGVAPYQYKWWVFDGSSWASTGDWSVTNTFNWKPTRAGANYRIGVWVRSAGRTADESDNDQANLSVTFEVTAAAVQTSTPESAQPQAPVSPLRLTTLGSDRSAPQDAGATIVFTAAASGGTAPYQYKWWIHDGSSWAISKDWSTDSSLAWRPTSPNSNYKIGVWVRSGSSTADRSDNDNSNRSIDFAIVSAAPSTTPPAVTTPAPTTPPSTTPPTTPPSAATPPVATPPVSTAPASPVSLLGLTANKVAPQPAGTSVTFTAAARDGSGTYEYKWWLFDGSSWSVLANWSASASYAWTPASEGGSYRIGVWVRNAGSGVDASDNAGSNGSVAFPISRTISQPQSAATPPSPLRLVALTSSASSPPPAGTPITFSAIASGGQPQYQYKWWLFDGNAWTVLSDWSQTTSSFTWTPRAPGSAYRIGVWVRSGTNTRDASDNDGANGSVPLVIR